MTGDLDLSVFQVLCILGLVGVFLLGFFFLYIVVLDKYTENNTEPRRKYQAAMGIKKPNRAYITALR